ncbi:MAG: site-2 protease family protein, partial [Candidatus Enteromonas sp.]
PGGFSNMSGIIGMTSALPQIEALGGVGYIFYFAGLLSINLAFFNLLPFPGLDGWQLVVTAFEAITRKKMPEKAQTIATIIGFTLLGLLTIAVTVKDIIALF